MVGQIYILVTYFITPHKANVARDALYGTKNIELVIANGGKK